MGTSQEKLRGPVRTLRMEFAEWDVAKAEWQPFREYTITSYRRDGSTGEVESHNSGSVTRCRHTYGETGQVIAIESWTNDRPTGRVVYTYDDAGRRTHTREVDAAGGEREIEEMRYDPQGRTTRIHTLPPGVEYHFHTIPEGEADEILARDEHGAIIRRISLTRDPGGRLVKEVVHLEGAAPFPGLPEESVTVLFPGNIFATTVHTYDSHGRLAETYVQMGTIGEDRMTYRYNEHDDPAEQTSSHHSREIACGADGSLETTSEQSTVQDWRFDYSYDAQGNWTERVAWMRTDGSGDWQRSNITRREIAYYEA